MIDYRSAGGDPASIRRHAAELVALAPDMVVTAGSLAPAPVLEATHSVPIVMVNVPDPVGAGWVQAPGAARQRHRLHQFRVQLGRQVDRIAQAIAPSITRVAVLRSATSVAGIGQFAAVQSHSFGIELTPVVRDADEIERGGICAPAPVV